MSILWFRRTCIGSGDMKIRPKTVEQKFLFQINILNVK